MNAEWILRATLVLLAVILATRLIRRHSAAACHLVAVLGLAVVVVLPLAGALLPTWELPIPLLLTTESTSQASVTTTVAELTTSPTFSPDFVSLSHKEPVATLSSMGDWDPASIPATTQTETFEWNRWLNFQSVWWVGLALFLGRLGFGWLRMAWVVRHSKPLLNGRVRTLIGQCANRLDTARLPRVRVSSTLMVPVLWGITRPTLILPTRCLDWSLERLRVVLLHELAHLQRLDGLSLLTGRIAAAVWWFHPIAWWVERQARRDCERACDDRVLSTGERPSDYATHLLEIAGELPQQTLAPVGALSIMGQGILETRLRSILRTGSRRRLTLRASVAIVSLLGLGATSIATVRPVPVAPAAPVAMRSQTPPAAPIAPQPESIAATPAPAAPVTPTERVRPDAPVVPTPSKVPQDAAVPIAPASPAPAATPDSRGIAAAPLPWGTASAIRSHSHDATAPAPHAYNVEAVAAAAVEGKRYASCEEARNCSTAAEAPLPDGEFSPARAVTFAIRRDKLEASVAQEIIAAQNWNSSSAQSEGKSTYNLAMKHHRAERWTEAIEDFKLAADLGYKRGASMYNVACGYARLGDTAEAIAWIERSREEGFELDSYLRTDADLNPIRSDPRFRELLAQEIGAADSGRVNDKYEAVLDQYEDLEASGSTDGAAWYKLGSALLSLHDFDDAIRALEKAADYLGDDSDAALYNLACAYALQNDTRPALDSLERAVLAGFESDERFENDSDLNAIRDSQRFAEIRKLHDFLSLDRFQNNWFDMGNPYSARRWKPAIDAYTTFVRENPRVGRAWHNLGWALHHSRRHAEARDAFERQLELGHSEGLATYNIACTYAMEENTTEAVRWLERAANLGSANFQRMRSDDDLDSLRDDPAFEKLMEQAMREAAHDGHMGITERIRDWIRFED